MEEVEPDEFLEKGKVPFLINAVPEMKELVSILKCHICYQLMTSPVMSTTGCSHNFCSVCVRNYLTFQQNCPKCLTEMHETQIKPNKVLQEVISLFRLFIPKIAEMVSTKKSVTSSQKNVAKNHNVSQSFNVTTNVSSSASKFDVSDLQESSQEPSHSFNGQNHSADQPGTSRLPAPKGHVSCPVCGINVPEGNINRHLDDCLSDQQTGKDRPAKSTGNTQTAQPVRSAASSQPVRLAGNTSFQPSTQSTVLPPQKKSMRPVTKVVYNLMKDAQLRDLLKKEGLETKGDRKTLINRHKKFSVLWNAQCEEDSPMSRIEIIRAVKREEQNLSTVGVGLGGTSGSSSAAGPSPSTQSLLSYDRKTDPKLIDTKRKEILQKNENVFSRLIEDVKRRKLEATKEKTSISIVNDGDLEVVADEDNDATIVNRDESSLDKENRDNSSQSSEDDFLTQTPRRKNKNSIIKTLKSDSEDLTKTSKNQSDVSPKKQSSKVSNFFVKTPQKSPNTSASNLSKSGELYVTPKRKSSRELLFEEPKRFRQQVIDSADPSGSQRRTITLKKSECPVCQSLVPVHLMTSHVDSCLEPTKKIETRRSNRRGLTRKSVREEEEETDQPDSDFEIVCTPNIEDFESMSSPELSGSPPLTSTVKKSKKK